MNRPVKVPRRDEEIQVRPSNRNNNLLILESICPIQGKWNKPLSRISCGSKLLKAHIFRHLKIKPNNKKKNWLILMIRNLEKGLAIIWFHRQNSVYSSYKEKCTWQLIQKFYSILHPDVISSHRSWIVSVIRAIIKKSIDPLSALFQNIGFFSGLTYFYIL